MVWVRWWVAGTGADDDRPLRTCALPRFFLCPRTPVYSGFNFTRGFAGRGTRRGSGCGWTPARQELVGLVDRVPEPGRQFGGAGPVASSARVASHRVPTAGDEQVKWALGRRHTWQATGARKACYHGTAWESVDR